MHTVIKPTVGRVVWYYPGPGDTFVKNSPGQPHAALVACVWSDTCVNLLVIDAEGRPASRTSVTLVQPGNGTPADVGFCTWMPYQIGQAAKTPAT